MQKKLPIFGIYEKALKPKRFEEMFLDAKKAGYDSFELSIDSTDEKLARLDWGKEKILSLKQDAMHADMHILTMCLSGHKRYPLGSSNPEVVKQGMEIMEKALMLSGNLGIRVIQLSGFDVYDQEPRTMETRKRYIDHLYEAVQMAERECVILAIEPVEGNLLAVQDTMEVVNQVDSPFLEIYPDFANINSLGIEPIRDMEYGKGHIVAVHMRESLPNSFDATVPFGTGTLDFDGVLRKLDELQFNGPMIVEMWNTDRPDYMEYITQAREFLTEHILKVRA